MFAHLFKFNPNHDPKDGRFTFVEGAGWFNKELPRGVVLEPTEAEKEIETKLNEAYARVGVEYHLGLQKVMEENRKLVDERIIDKNTPTSEKDIMAAGLTRIDMADGGKHDVATSELFADHRKAEQDVVKLRQAKSYLESKRMGPPEFNHMQQLVDFPRKQTETKDFKKWFGDSKVVDEQGRPLIVFHGSRFEIDQFQTRQSMTGRKIKNNQWLGNVGTWFAAPSRFDYDKGNAESVAEEFASHGRDDIGVVYPVFLSIKNPKVYHNYFDAADARDFYGSNTRYRAELKRQGYDGIVIRGSTTDGNVIRDDWVAFNPQQIKSAIGNIGKFSKRDKRITKFNPNHDELGRFATIGVDQTSTPEFKAWFGKSKIVNKDGTPMVVYHGGASGVEEFDPNKAGSVQYSDWGKGIYFTNSQWVANQYQSDASVHGDEQANKLYDEYEQAAKRLGTSPMTAAIDLGFGSEKYNQLQEYDKRWRQRLEEIRQKPTGETYGVYLRVEKPYYYEATSGMPDPTLAAYAQGKGYDGLVIDGGSEIVVFHPNQIKSATHNTGGFSREDNRIHKMNPYHDDLGRFTSRAGGVQAGHGKIPTVTAMQQAMLKIGPQAFEDAVTAHIASLGKELAPEDFAHEIERVARRVIAQKFNPNHEPAGSPKGGQFASHQSDDPPYGTKKEFQEAFYKKNGVEGMSYQQMIDKLGEEKATQMFEAIRENEQKWEAQMEIAISMGKITDGEAHKRGYYNMSGGKFQKLPDELFHVTTDAERVMAEGLKTRDELGPYSALGLGGGTSNTISFTDDQKIAEGIHSAMLFAHDVMNDKITLSELVDMAREGKNATRPFLDDINQAYGGGLKGKDGVAMELSLGMEGRRGENVSMFDKRRHDAQGVIPVEVSDANDARLTAALGAGYRHEGVTGSGVFSRPATVKEMDEIKMNAVKKFLFMREYAGGPFDPLFFGTNTQGFKNSKRENIKIIRAVPKPNTVGYRMSSLGEIRVMTGRVIDKMTVFKNENTVIKFDPDYVEKDDMTGQDLIDNGGLLSQAQGVPKRKKRRIDQFINSTQKAERYVKPFVSFQDSVQSVADDMTKWVSGLHQSRLASYGFVQEANALDVQAYAINEMLDKRTCPVCRMMNGKRFLVDDAGNALREILDVQEPDDLKVLQPWPKQDKRSVEEMSKMTNQELVDMNWHIPPFHPLCRGVLDAVDNVQDIPPELDQANTIAPEEDIRPADVPQEETMIPKELIDHLLEHTLAEHIDEAPDLLAILSAYDPSQIISAALIGLSGLEAARVWVQLKNYYSVSELEAAMGVTEAAVLLGQVGF